MNDPPAGGSSISTVAGFVEFVPGLAEAGPGFVGSVPGLAGSGFAVPVPRSGRSPEWGSWVGVLNVVLQIMGVVLQVVGTGPGARVPQVMRAGPAVRHPDRGRGDYSRSSDFLRRLSSQPPPPRTTMAAAAMPIHPPAPIPPPVVSSSLTGSTEEYPQ